MHYNEHGPVATTYEELQALNIVKAAYTAQGLPVASPLSMLRAILQAVEIGLLNLSDLMERAAHDVSKGNFERAMVKLYWARGFHRVLGQLAVMPQQCRLRSDAAVLVHEFSIHDSSAFTAYFSALQHFDQNLLVQIEQGSFSASAILQDYSLDTPTLSLLHLTRVCNHEAVIWERNLCSIRLHTPVDSYEVLVMPSVINDMVYGLRLMGDTFFTQFRGLHQIPEILCIELNDRLEAAIKAIRTEQLQHAVEYLDDVQILLGGMLAALPPIIDSLATSDYHAIRENLGLTSGSHSVALHYHLFEDLYDQLAQVLLDCITVHSSDVTVSTPEEMFRQIAQTRFDDMTAWMLHGIAQQCLQLRTGIDLWRELHQHLPRNNLGGNATRSLTGAPDAIRAVHQMHYAARRADAHQSLVNALGQAKNYTIDQRATVERYLASDASLDSYLLGLTGTITQSRFQDVQNRLGYFAARCPFKAPPRREVQ